MDIVWVTADRCSPQSGRQIAKQLRALNTRLKKAQRPYLLVGPGRWGSSDPYLGIPVSWGDISGARVIVERPMRDRHVEPSHGTHFFRNVTAHRIGYITVRDTPDSWLHLDRYEAVAGSQEADTLIRHASLDEPIGVYLDGPRGRALVSHGGLTAAPPSSAGSQRATDTSHPQS